MIKTECILPPVPSNRFDWRAHVVDMEDGTGSGQATTAYGATELEALRNLCEQLAVLYLENLEAA